MKHIWTILLVVALAQASFGQLSGPLSGTLGPGTYTVIAEIRVDAGNTLTLMPGTTFIFDGPYAFQIYGTLLAEGTEGDSIVFTTEQSGSDRWRGLRFEGAASSGSVLSYCVVEKGYVVGSWPDNAGGGGVFCSYSSPTLTNCAIRLNSAIGRGGGMACSFSSPTLFYCVIGENSVSGSSGDGGGLYCNDSSPTLTNCIVSQNSATGSYGDGGGACFYSSSPILINCTFSGNSGTRGGGVYCHGSLTLTNCRIIENLASVNGGGMFFGYSSTGVLTDCSIEGNSGSTGGGVCCYASSSPTFANCSISGNSAGVNGGGVWCDNSSPAFLSCQLSSNISSHSGGAANCINASLPSFENCTINGNSCNDVGGGIACWPGCSPNIANCTFHGNSSGWGRGGGIYCATNLAMLNSTIIAFSIGSGIEFENAAGSQVEYCDFFGNSGGNITFDPWSDPSQGPSGIGQITTTNGNGDPCDQYFNIFLDPLFVDTASCDFHLGDFSPCIGAGDPTDPPPFDMDSNPRPNPPGSLPDIGAYEHWRDVPLPVELTTFQAFAGDGQVKLHWRTESEMNNNHFVIYKRKAGEEVFRELTEIPGHGTTTEPHDYEYVDRFVRNGITYEYQISDVDIAGRETIHEQIASATPSAAVIPMEFVLDAPYPNPFNPTTTIRYDVKETGLVTLKVFDLLGREVAILVHGTVPAGSYSVEWNAGDLPSGVYLCRMEADGFQQTRKVVLLK